MSQTSPVNLPKPVKERLHKVFIDLLIDIDDREQAEKFFQNFLTPTEQINFPKRLGIYILLAKNEERRLIRNSLKVSLTTINSVRKKVLAHGLSGLSRFIKRILGEKKPEIVRDPDQFRAKRVKRKRDPYRPYGELPF